MIAAHNSESHRGYRYRLNPTSEQEELFRRFTGVCRLIYNLGLEQRQSWWRQYTANTGRRLNYFGQSSELTQLRAHFDWIAAVPHDCQLQALRDLDHAFTAYLTGQRGHPKPRQKGLHDAFRFRARETQCKKINGKWSAVRLPKIGWVKYRDTRPLPGAVKTVTVSLDALGWHVSFCCQIERRASALGLPAVGIDRGVENTISLSTGGHICAPKLLNYLDRRYRAAQRKLARKVCGSIRRQKQRQRAAKLAARRARVRNDWLHRASLGVAQRFGLAVLEDLNIKGMTASAKGTVAMPGRNVRQKSGLNRSILNQGWHIFETMLAYKLEERGGSLAKVSPAYTSQTCSACGVVDARSRESQASFSCVSCGHRAHADTNAAINILRRNTASMRVEGGHKAPNEARTRRGRKAVENPPAGGRC